MYFLITTLFKKQKLLINTKETPLSFSEKEYHWPDEGISEDLNTINIFDSFFGHLFIGNDGEINYEPSELKIFDQLIDIVDNVKKELEKKEKSYESKIPKIPSNLTKTDGASWLNNLSAQTSPDEINKYCSFTEEDKKELSDISKRILEQSPSDRASELEKKKKHLDEIINYFKSYSTKFSNKNCEEIFTLKEELNLKKTASKAASEKIFSNSKLDGIGTDIWKELWEAARKYSKYLAYPKDKFPVVEKDDAKCILCHQTLNKEAKDRLLSFEEHIKGEIEKDVFRLEQKLKQTINNLPDIIAIEALKTKIDAAGIANEELKNDIVSIISEFQKIKEILNSYQLYNLDKINNHQKTDSKLALLRIKELEDISQAYKDDINKYIQDANNDNREQLKNRKNSLKMKHWLCEQNPYNSRRNNSSTKN